MVRIKTIAKAEKKQSITATAARTSKIGYNIYISQN
jgi:hypothetical protein